MAFSNIFKHFQNEPSKLVKKRYVRTNSRSTLYRNEDFGHLIIYADELFPQALLEDNYMIILEIAFILLLGKILRMLLKMFYI